MFSPLLYKLFPGTKTLNGIIESELVTIPRMKAKIDDLYSIKIHGELLFKKIM
jgi:D-serine dehydratase